MNWTAWKSEFCWNWLEITPGHRHTDSNEILWGLNYLFWKLMFFYFAILSINFHFYFRFSTFMYIEDLISWYFGVFIVALIFNIIINSTILGGFAAIADCNCWGIVLTIIGLLFLGLESKYYFSLTHSILGYPSWLWQISSKLIYCVRVHIYRRNYYSIYLILFYVSLRISS